MTKDMTKGNPLKLILLFAIPLLIGSVLQQAYNVIDAAIVGQFLGTKALGAVGATTSVQFMVMGFCIGVSNGVAIPVARDFGAGDMSRMRRVIFHAVILEAIIAVILTLFTVGFCHNILRILSVPEDIYQDTYSYIVIIFMGIPFTILYNMLASILRAVGDSKTPFYFLAFSSVLNVILDLVFIIVLKLGCAGAAIATITGQGVSGILCLILVLKRYTVLLPTSDDRQLSGAHFIELLVMGVPMGLQYSITAIGSMFMQSANNGLGSLYVSSFTAASKIKLFIMCPFDSVATGVSVFSSQNMGAGKMDRIRKGILQGTIVNVIYGVLAGISMILFGREMSLIFVSPGEQDVLALSARYLMCLGFFFGSLGILNTLRMTTQGLGFSGRAIFSGVTEMFARILVCSIFVPKYGFTAICFADQSAWLSACAYIVPTCLYGLRKVEAAIEAQKKL